VLRGLPRQLLAVHREHAGTTRAWARAVKQAIGEMSAMEAVSYLSFMPVAGLINSVYF
jgi:hypothetical protein